LVGLAGVRRALFPEVAPDEVRRGLLRVLRMPPVPDGCGSAGGLPEVRRERRWVAGDLVGEELSWEVGFGPRARGWLLRPRDADGPLPGVLALHCHGGKKYWGKEKLADDDRAPAPEVRAVRDALYGGAAVANRLARRGFAVLCHDVLMWGSRRFPLTTMPARITATTDATTAGAAPDGAGASEAAGAEMSEAARYDLAAGLHEHTVAKYCNLLGTSLAGLVVREDLIAVRLLAALPEVDAGRLGCFGLSGGGLRAGLLGALDERVGATVVTAMMSTFPAMLDAHVDPHTWLLWPPDVGTVADWPDLVACRAPAPLLVQYDADDRLFPPAGMRAAHRRLADRYARAGQPGAYRGSFHPGGHKFDLPMQQEAFDWLAAVLAEPLSP
jgi:dienelactone hydrolase